MMMHLKGRFLFLLLLLGLLACQRTSVPAPDAIAYSLSTGATATFTAKASGLELRIQTGGVPIGTVAALYYGPMNEQQGRAALLGSVNAAGETVFVFSALENGLPFGFGDLQNFDGCLRLYTTSPYIPILAADVGGNAITGDVMPYTLVSQNNSGVSGSFTIYKRKNGQSRIDVALTGTQAGSLHPMHIHLGGPSVCGSIAVTLNSVVGATGSSNTTVRAYDSQGVQNSGAPVSYSDLLGLNKCLKVHTSSVNDAEIATN